MTLIYSSNDKPQLRDGFYCTVEPPMKINASKVEEVFWNRETYMWAMRVK